MTKSLNSIKLGLIIFAITGGLFISFLIIYSFYSGDTVTATYNSGDIPTSFQKYDSTCNAPSVLEVMLPEGDSTIHVTGVDITYTMTALGEGKKIQQRSQVVCVNNNQIEPQIYSGTDSAAGKMEYHRTNVSIANGDYPGGSALKFAMHAWRTLEGSPGCNSASNRVDAGSWKITVHYTATANQQNSDSENSSFLENTNSNKGMIPPHLSFTERNKIKNPLAGTIIWCSNCGPNGELQIWNGSAWKALLMSTPSDSVASPKLENKVNNDATPSVSVREIVVKDLPADTIIGTNFKGPYGKGKPTLFNLASNSIVPNNQESSTNWDLAFSATTIKINNGTSGPGIGGALVFSGSYESLHAIPKNAVLKTDKFPYFAIFNAPGMGWYQYNRASDLITPIPGKTILIRTANGKYAKLEILNYYKGGKTPAMNSNFKNKVLDSRYYTFRYTYQPDGSMNF